MSLRATQAKIFRIFNAAAKAGVSVRVEIRDDAIIATTLDKAAAPEASLSADDELERWRRKRGNAN